MTTLSWNEIKTRASAFVNEWQDKAPTAREEADAQTFETGFFNIFGIKREKVAIFEKKVKMKDGVDTADLFGDGDRAASGYIDLFWKGHILIEMKTPGKDLSKAYEQAKAYANALPPADLPKGILICDFVRFDYYDLTDAAKRYRFTLPELPRHIELFGYLAGYKDVEFQDLDPVNVEAAEKMSRLHNRLAETGYEGRQLEIYLVRLLFCLFADDTGIFPHDHFVKYIIERTKVDGSDLALHLAMIFETLNKPEAKRLTIIDERLKAFPYVDGELFEERLETAAFDSAMREALIECTLLDWSGISPAVFGAMFQGVMDDEARHDIGAHYTSEKNIMKVIKPLFLDGLQAEFEKIKAFTTEIRRERLVAFHKKLRKLKFLDPACGCGNFLIISYREIRLLELDIITELEGNEQSLDVDTLIWVNVDQFYGLEIEEFPAQIAQTALWLMDHQMNMKVRERFGQYYGRIPLTASPSIVNGNALSLDWESVVPKAELSYILGNPPFLGKKEQSATQKAELEHIFEGIKRQGVLDYVTCWYKKAAQYIQGTSIEVAFVSTNSITQGEQVPVLWPILINQHGVKINFAHHTFKWSNEARGKAAVHCVIIGFSLSDRNVKKLFHYAEVTGEPVESRITRINPYLVDAETIFLESRSIPLSKAPPMNKGNHPLDGGYLLLSNDERKALLQREPGAGKFILPFISNREFLNGSRRWCLWLNGAEPAELRHLPEVMKRVKQVKQFRLNSVSASTRKLATTPTLFRDRKRPDSCLVIPTVSSERRLYIPMGFVDKNSIVGITCLFVPNAALYHFGILTSTMHMAWMRYVCGRMKSDYQYSKDIVYNNFPWPTPAAKQQTAIETAAQAVLDARTQFSKSSLADLYDPVAMPPELAKAHQKLDKAVEAAYGRTFANDAERVAYLFEMYQKLNVELFVDTKKRGKGRKA